MLIRIFSAYTQEIITTLSSISLMKSTRDNGIWQLQCIDIRKYGIGKHKKIDEKTYGGGSGLVMRPDVLSGAIEDNIPNLAQINDGIHGRTLLLTSPRGQTFSQKTAEHFSQMQEINIICNRFEGVDQRVIDFYKMQEISIGNYILLGGEIAACVIMEATLRLIPRFLENHEAKAEESFSQALQGRLEYPHFTEPRIWNDIAVPQVLLSGNHAKIKQWRESQLKIKE